MKTIEVEAYPRTTLGTSASRRLRRQGYMPAVFYGPGVEPFSLSVKRDEFLKQLAGERPEGTFVRLKIEGGSGGVSEKLSVIKQVQVDTLKRSLVHADFYEIKMDRELTVDLQIHFTGTPKGVEEGGEVQLLKREVRVSGLPGSLPEFVELDISGLDIGDTLMVGDLSIEENVRVLDGEDVALVAVAAMRMTKEEMIGEKVAEGEGEAEEEAGGEQGEEREE